MSIDDPEHIELMRDRIEREQGSKPDYLFLSDPGHRVIDRYGLRNEDDSRGIPHPAVFVVDRDGVVRWKFIEKNFRVRATNEMILEALRGLENRG